MNPVDCRQLLLKTLRVFDRAPSDYEAQLKTAIQSDPRVQVVMIQVRRFMKSDKTVFITSRGGNLTKLMLLFDFMCPCGEVRREYLYVPLNWKQPHQLAQLKKHLRQSTFDHLASEGLL